MVQFLSLRIVDICVRVLLLQDFAFLDPHTKISIIFLPMEVFGAWKIPLPAYQTRFFMNFVYSAPSSTRLIMIESALLFTICKFIKSCLNSSDKWVKLFKNRSSKTCARQSLKNLKWYGMLRQTISLQIFERLSSTNFTWSILQYLDLNSKLSCFKAYKIEYTNYKCLDIKIENNNTDFN